MGLMIEGGYRPQNKEAAFDANAPGGYSHWKDQNRKERHVGNSEVQAHNYFEVLKNDLDIAVPVRLSHGEPVEVAHLYLERDDSQFQQQWRQGLRVVDGVVHISEEDHRRAELYRDLDKVQWWIEREPVAAWHERVRSAHAVGHPRYKAISEYQTPSVVTHTYPSGGYYNERGYHSAYDVGHMVARNPIALALESSEPQLAKEPRATQVYPEVRPVEEGIEEYAASFSAIELLSEAGDLLAPFSLGNVTRVRKAREEAARAEWEEFQERLRKKNQPDPHLEFLAKLRKEGKLES